MSWLTEDPTLVLVIGALALSALIVALLKTGRAVLVLAILGVVLVVGACVLLEFLVVTERERVEATVYGVAAAMQDNDTNRVLSYISTRAGNVREQAQWVLRMFEVEEAKITDGPFIVINELTSPPSATVELMAVARGKLRTGSLGHKQFPSRFVVTLGLENDQWRIEHVEQQQPFGP